MGCCNLRSLLLAAIFLSSCITWTASRHHYAHNASYHRSRHRRQGAGLYLTSSFVIPGGVGAGSWGDWDQVSPCSRTCGGGVAHQKRICLELGPDGRSTCIGGNTKYFSCNTQDCPPGSEDFRAEQCSSYNAKSFKGTFYEWVPYTRGLNPCELNCKPQGDRFYYRFQQKVIDGTRCNDESFDVCVDGVCQAVGCDMMLGSNSKEDKCRVCRGNGNNCDTIQGLIDSQDFTQGYNDIILIPENATNIYIREIRESNNYLALRNQNNTYYLNGDFRIDFPQRIHIAGMVWHYQRNELGFSAPDELRCQGPTTEPLYLSLLLQDKNVGIEYEYSLPQNMANRVKQKYNWAHDNFTECSATCGGGHQVRSVSCRTDDELEVVDDELCDRSLKPAVNQSCNTEACAPEWKTDNWGECSKRCGKGGIQSRNVYCEKIITNGFPSIVSNKECLALLGAQPDVYQTCNEDAPCPKWFTGPWKPCDKLCGEGKQIRQVVCHQKNHGKVEILEDQECEDTKPSEEQACMLKICEGVDWLVTDWVGCDTCLSTVQTRTAVCTTDELKVVNDSFCSHHPTPIVKMECTKDMLSDKTACETQWYSSQWGNCSVDCGKGNRSREVFCGKSDGKSVIKVDDNQCDITERYEDTKPCEVPPEECPAKWFAGPWTKCSKECDEGTQLRKVTCLNGTNQESDDCNAFDMLDSTRSCNRQPCNADQIIPKDSSSKPIIDDYDEDCDEDEYPEIGAEELLSSEGDLFSSSISGYTEGSGSELESEFSSFSTSDSTESTEFTDSTDTGSGDFSREDISTKDDYDESTSTSESNYTDETSSSTDDSSEENKSTDDTSSTIIKEKSTTTSESKKPVTKAVTTMDPEDTKPPFTRRTTLTTTTPGLKSTESREVQSSTVVTNSENTESTLFESTETTPSGANETTDSGATDTTESGATVTTESGATEITRSESIDTTYSGATETTLSEATETTESGTTRSGSIDTTESGATETTSSEATETTESGTTRSGSIDTTESGATETTLSETTETTESGATGSGSINTTQSGATETTVSEATETTDSETTESTDSGTTETTVSETTETTESGATYTTEYAATESTQSGPTETTKSETTETTESEATETTKSEATESTNSEATETTESERTETTESEKTETTEYEATATTGSESTEKTESEGTEITKSESTETTESEATETTHSGPTETIHTGSTETTETNTNASTTPSDSRVASTTETSTSITETDIIENGTTTETAITSETETQYSTTDGSSPDTETTQSVGTETTESVTTKSSELNETTLSETAETTTLSGTSETTPLEILNTTLSETVETTALSESVETTTSSDLVETTSPVTYSSTLSEIFETTTSSITTESTESGTTDNTTTEVSTLGTISSAKSDSTENETTVTTETSVKETDIVKNGTTTEASTTETTITTEAGSTDNTTASIATSPSETSFESTTTTHSSQPSETEEPSETSSSTSWSWASTVQVFTTKKHCKKRKNCGSAFGCCPDKKSPAKGPFDKGCPHAATCKDTDFGCCPDGVSPASGPNNDGCPAFDCNETLFGCCLSDNKTVAEDNDQTGCPPPCQASKYGCCKDNETEAQGLHGKGCEPDTTTTETPSSSTEVATSTTEVSSTPSSIVTTESTTSSDYSSSISSVSSSLSTSESVVSSSSTVSAEINTSTSPPEGCSTYEFGCCLDNETKALGPNEEGCPCAITINGCCPDGITPAGINMNGCKSCNTSAHGCCPDGVNPAHGPDGEGCCLQSAYGCCPDNYKPAEGPHLEGCGCQYARFGCCPDNETIARGINNEGCGCKYSTFGCCPDGLAAATGEDFQGCTCESYQFGCCSDGVTKAKGPNQQGCLCQETEFGCCEDEETPARGTNKLGCDCSNSKFGCCPDGQTPAKGVKFDGCTDIPENKQVACGLPSDLGPCREYAVYWHFNTTYGDCYRFWYGGCEGNDNKFPTQEECRAVCVNPSPKDACKLPKSKGTGEGNFLRWYYDSTREQCKTFEYGGWYGNANNFETKERCQEQCEPPRTEDQCKVAIDPGSCSGNFGRWGFNPETKDCEQFIWGGCEGNNNRFSSREACLHRCNPPGSAQPECTELQDVGNCTNKIAAWSFSLSENRCVPFYYTGCGGNGNNFDTEELCSDNCPSVHVQDDCHLPASIGDCADYTLKWFYDSLIKRCRQFYYGGCGGNNNNFDTEYDCESKCSDKTTTTSTTITTPSTTLEPFKQEFCFLEKDPGPCNDVEPRWAYDSARGKCTQFEYGGCNGNRNNFLSEEKCNENCRPTQDICQLPMRAGSCEESQMKWFYDATSDYCSQFTYSGCDGNDNRFDSLEDCQQRCRSENPPESEVPPPCVISETLEECSEPGVVWYLDKERRECLAHRNLDRGQRCRTSGVFSSRPDCEDTCAELPGLIVHSHLDIPQSPTVNHETEPEVSAEEGGKASLKCLFHSNPPPLITWRRGQITIDGDRDRYRLLSDGTLEILALVRSDAGVYICVADNGLGIAKQEINLVIKDTNVCQQVQETGPCSDYVYNWFYDESKDVCSQFWYGGCEGNGNNFKTQEQCEGQCKKQSANTTTTTSTTTTTTTTVSPIIEPEVDKECRTPKSLEPCGRNISTFYYDSRTGICTAGNIGGCGYLNNYRSEEECERRCGRYLGLEVCRYPLDPGPCRAANSKFYWDEISGSCKNYAYGGCEGSPNRFSTIEECEEVCKPIGPAPSCLQPEAVGSTRCGQQSSRRWYYSTLTGECLTFLYEGCDGNENNFISYEQCETLCKPNKTIDNNVLPDCSRYTAECDALRCEFGVQRVRTADDCERCSCVPVDYNCTILERECEQLKCSYGVKKTVGSDGCQRCSCHNHPCAGQYCREGERCVATQYRDSVVEEVRFSAECRIVDKPGSCPAADPSLSRKCRRECNDDADCRGVGKCCKNGCSKLCLSPVYTTTTLLTTLAPNIPQSPTVNHETEPEVSAEEGGKASLKCLFHSNPPPLITWRRGQITIDGDRDRYRLLSDGTLEILALVRSDAGVYICVADNGLGIAKQEINLVIKDPVETEAKIGGEPVSVVEAELGKPQVLQCLAYGYPPPSVAWYKGIGGPMVPYVSKQYEARGNSLLIREVNAETLGEYVCDAYNGVGDSASWVVTVRARSPENNFIDQELVQPATSRPPHRTPDLTTTQMPQFDLEPNIERVQTAVRAERTTLPAGAELSVQCEATGYPPPLVRWTKDGVRLNKYNDKLFTLTETRLRLVNARPEDSGVYGCFASNQYSEHESSIRITVRDMYLPASCTDNPLFANCVLIVRSKFCKHRYYSRFCCKSCAEAGQLEPEELLQGDQPLRR